MDPFRRLAMFTVARDAGFAALATATLMLGFSFHPSLALLIGANAALWFCLALVFRACRLTDERIIRTEPWRALEPEARPAGEAGRRSARAAFQDLLLRSAKTASVVAVALCGATLLASEFDGAPSEAFARLDRQQEHRIVTAATAALRQNTSIPVTLDR